MKKLTTAAWGYLLLLACNLSAQGTAPMLPADTLSLAFSKTSSIIFPRAIKSVDRGSGAILAQKATGTENILQLRAGQECFEETNLTVVSSGGKLYNFIVRYDPENPTLALAVDKPLYDDPQVVFCAGTYNTAEIADYAKLALIYIKNTLRITDSSYGVRFSLTGLFIHDKVMYLRLQIVNGSNISFDPQQLRFLIRDKVRATRTASQEIELEATVPPEMPQQIAAHDEAVFVVALPKFTIPDKKYLAIQVAEATGGRHYEIKVSGAKLIKPVMLGQ